MPSAETTLRGVGWDHPRCRRALSAVAPEGVVVDWDYRPLAHFNDGPLSELADAYDLLVIDYPHVGIAADQGLLTPLDSIVSDRVLNDISANSVGPTYRSFTYADHQWALPIDAACHVSAAVHEVLAARQVQRPASWRQVVDLFRSDPDLVVLPFLPADAICCLLTLQATSGRPVPEEATAVRFDPESISLLGTLRRLLPDFRAELSPPDALELIRSGDVAYCPVLFGYSEYADPVGEGLTIRYGPVPGTSPRGLLGGAGLAVSARSPDVAAVVNYVASTFSIETQRRIASNGGQPAHNVAWTGHEIENPFFRDTRGAIERAYVRPSRPWWGRAQRRLGETLVEGVASDDDPVRVAHGLEQIVAAAMEEGG